MKFYVASKTKHAGMWKEWRDRGAPFVSTWIDEAGPGQTRDKGELWERIFNEIRSLNPAEGDALICYCGHDDGVHPETPLEGTHIEVGAALMTGVPVLSVGRPHKTVSSHALYERYKSIGDALRSRGVALPEPQ